MLGSEKVVYPNRIQELRLEKEMSQTELARQFDVSISGISRWESGDVEPSADNLKRLVKFFKLGSVRDLYIKRV